MKIEAGQVYFLENPRLRKSLHGHPAVVLRAAPTLITIAYCSTKFELKISEDLTINELDEGFKSTGLKRTSFLCFRHIAEIGPDYFNNAPLLGRVTGEIKAMIEDWWGDTF